MLSLSESFYGAVNLLSRRGAPDTGILSGADPSAYNPGDPLRLWIIQVVLIVFMSQLLGVFLRRIKQPSVIAEILAGIILGPTAMGRIPGFTHHVFPAESLPFLSLAANIGLVLFLFIVGLEIDASHIRRNTRVSVTIALFAMVIPFGIGVGVSKLIYQHFIPSSVKYTHYMLFNGVSFSITAFPVLCRILTELKLLDTTVGVVVLSAGVCNDIVGWALLALAVALVNASSSLTALWVILVTFGWSLFLVFPVRWGLFWFARRTNSLNENPSLLFMTITMMFVLVSSFFTDVIGVHAIFGGFLAGLAVPREGGLAIALVEKLEDMVGIIFLPLYFTLSGLSTNLGLLNTGTIWGFTFLLIVMDYLGKFTGGTLGARLAGFKLREAATVGTLMSCKGLVELVVLNIGLQAGILTQQVFSMFVLDALFLTFCTTPVAVTLYPPHRRLHVSRAGQVKQPIDAEGRPTEEPKRFTSESLVIQHKTRFTVMLDKFDHLPGVISLSQLISSSTCLPSSIHIGSDSDSMPSRKEQLIMTQAMSITALRLIELTDRSSTIMKSSIAENLLHSDPLLKIFKTVGDLNDAQVSNELDVVPLSSFGRVASDAARSTGSDLLVVGWAPTTAQPQPSEGDGPFDYLLRANTASSDIGAATATAQVIRSVFKDSPVDVALFMDQRSSNSDSYGHKHIFMPFFGGADDRSALQLVVQLCLNPRISATVIRITKSERQQKPAMMTESDKTSSQEIVASGFTIATLPAFPETVYGHQNTAIRLQSTLADDMLWESCTSPAIDSLHVPALRRITFVAVPSTDLVETVIDYAQKSWQIAELSHGRLLAIIGRSRMVGSPGAEAVKTELTARLEKLGSSGYSGELRRMIGDPATALLSARLRADLLVVQASRQQLAEEA